MKTISAVCAFIVFTAVSAQAQFLGDTMAAAGFAETEYQLGASGIGYVATSSSPPQASSISMSNQPRASTNVSNPVLSNTGGYAPPPASGGTSYIGPGAQPLGSTGGGEIPPGNSLADVDLPHRTTAEDATSWKEAYKPVGATVTSLPSGSEAVEGNWGTLQYNKGVFYKQEGSHWVVVPAPIGAKVKERPVAGSVAVIQGVPYVYYNGTFFEVDRGIVEVVPPPAGAIVTNIPKTAKKMDRNGETCYVYGDVCFRPTFRGTSIVYVVS